MAVLIEREGEIGRVAEALAEAASGSGRALLIEAPAGMGKTALLADVAGRATRAGLRPLVAQASELGRDLAFGVARELLSAVVQPDDLAGAARHARDVLGTGPGASGGADRAARIQALGIAALSAAGREPLMLAVDDAQWCDEPSLDFLGHLGGRVARAPMLVLLAGRPDPGIALPAHAEIIRLEPLSETGVGMLVERELGERPAPGFAAACREAAGGNPFLTAELVRELRRAGVRPAEEAIGRVRAARPDTITRAVVVRLRREAPAVVSLARALAVLRPGAPLRHAAAVAGIEADAAAAAADALIRAGILADRRPLEFVHPIVRGAIDADMTTAERAARHGLAARVLAGEGAAAEQVAVHLLEAEPAADDAAVSCLLEAAATARARGAPDVAVHFLRRALDEPAGARGRLVELELGRAEALAGTPGGGLDHLLAILAGTPDGPERAELAIEVAQACVPLGRFADAVATLAGAIAGLTPGYREIALRAEALRASAGHLHLDTFTEAAERLERVASGLHGDTPSARMVHATLAFQRLLGGGRAEEAAGLAQAAMDGGLLAEQTADSSPVFDALFVLVTCADAARARHACEAVLEDARSRGTLMGVGVSLNQRSLLNLRSGRVAEAEADARAALEAAELGRHVRATGAVCHLAEALLERGRPGEALDLLARHGLDGPLPGHFLATLLLSVRGRLRIAAGDLDPGIADLEALAGRQVHSASPVVVPWRSALAVALSHRGDREQARDHATAGLAAADATGSPWARAVALHALGVAAADEGRLRAAADTAAACGAVLEQARALVDLGALMRRDGRATDARGPLRAGGELAHTAGATALEDRARDELAATGVRRVKRLLLSGVEGLTPSELRVARMAAEGMTNRAIAQALFVTPKTVEVHLGNAYRKLGIRSRAELDGVALGESS